MRIRTKFLLQIWIQICTTLPKKILKSKKIPLSTLSAERLSIHFSAHIELNQRILNSFQAQRLVDVLLAELPRLKQLHIFTFPPVRIQLVSPTLQGP
jgi:hypothetical protein